MVPRVTRTASEVNTADQKVETLCWSFSDETEGGGKGAYGVAKDGSAVVVNQGKGGFLI